MSTVRKGQAPAKLNRDEFRLVFSRNVFDPDYDLSVEWKEAHDRILLINGAARNDGSCPSEISKTWRLSKLCEEVLRLDGFETDLLDLSLTISDFDRHIHPCKARVSTAMPLCHWPCSCYPNHSLHQNNDWMNEIYEKWVRAHGVIILSPVYW